MLDTLQAHLDSFDHEDDVFVRLDALRFDEERDDAVLDLAVRGPYFNDGYDWSRWEVRAMGVRNYRVQRAWGYISLYDSDHILARCLWEPRRQLYSSGRVPNPDAAVGRLAVAHAELGGPWVRFDEYLRGPAGLSSLLAQRVALLAEGPESFIQAYAEALGAEGTGSSVVDGAPALHWDGQGYVANEQKPNLTVLTLGDAFFVAVGFEESRRT